MVQRLTPTYSCIKFLLAIIVEIEEGLPKELKIHMHTTTYLTRVPKHFTLCSNKGNHIEMKKQKKKQKQKQKVNM